MIDGTFEIIDQHSTGGDQSKEWRRVAINNDGEWTYTPETELQNGNDFFLVKFTQDNCWHRNCSSRQCIYKPR